LCVVGFLLFPEKELLLCDLFFFSHNLNVSCQSLGMPGYSLVSFGIVRVEGREIAPVETSIF